jgi:hypothetical protein
MDSADDLDDVKDKKDTKKLASKWLSEIDRAKKALQSYWKICEKIQKLYTEEKALKNGGSTSASSRKFCLLWSNISTLQPSVYARTPAPVVARRYRDRDPVARQVCNVMERALEYNYDRVGFEDVMETLRDEFLLFGKCHGWARYEADIGESEEPDPETGEPIEQVLAERVVIDPVHPMDFIFPTARTWAELPWLARRTFLTKAQMKERFGKAADKVQYDHGKDEERGSDGDESGPRKAIVYEIWSKADNEVCWVSPGYDDVLDHGPPHLELEGFYPTPMPCYGTKPSDSLIPSPDYLFYMDQAEEIDDLTNRIMSLTESLKLVGFYNAGPSEEGVQQIQIALKAGTENMLIPIPSYAAWAEKGGVNQIQWLPVDQVIKVLEGCFEARKRLIADVYQITGISDILRGESDPRETSRSRRSGALSAFETARPSLPAMPAT